jgi:membrane protein YqaA with SNARE-associated domain
MTDSIVGAVGIYGGTFVVCFIAGLVPLVNAEIFLVLVSTMLVTSSAPLPAIVVLAAAGQMVAKVVLYVGARRLIASATGARREKIERAQARIEKWKDRPLWVLFASSTLGLPPFYVVSLLAGALKIRLRAFLAIGMTGRVLRFAVIVAIPWL